MLIFYQRVGLYMCVLSWQFVAWYSFKQYVALVWTWCLIL